MQFLNSEPPSKRAQLYEDKFLGEHERSDSRYFGTDCTGDGLIIGSGSRGDRR